MGLCMSKTGLFMNPTVKVMGAHVVSVGLTGVQLDVTLRVGNPNPASLHATRVIYTLTKTSDGTTLADGVDRTKFTLEAANDNNRVVVPMSFKYWGIGSAGKSLVQRGQTEITVSGEITFDAPLAPGGTATSKFEEQVTLDLDKMMK